MYNFRSFVTAVLLFTSLATSADEVGTGTGTVKNVIDVGSYTYVQLQQENIWIATTHLAIVAGDEIEFSGGMEMKDFYSKTLDRTFESIIFVQKANRVGDMDMDSLHSSVAGKGETEGAMVAPQSASVKAPEPGDIDPLSGGMTIAGIQENATRLKDTIVELRAKVVKVNPNIMGKNWITLQDGTGTKPNDKLIATSDEMVSPGELVTASGVVRNNIDIGSGYKYKVLLEQAKFTQSTEAP
ncbi:MAG: hypothetical protein ABW124_15515 [Candidatus Thiodiazotropha sp. 6PLUC9]